MDLDKLWNFATILLASIIFRLRIFVVNTIKTLPRDTTALYRLQKLRLQLLFCKWRNSSVGDLFDVVVKENPDKICFHFQNVKWTFLQVQQYSNNVGRYFLQKGFQKGDCVALMMTNRPEFVCLWLGLSKIGVITSWINTNLRQDSLIHCLKVGNAKAAILGHECYEPIADIYKTTAPFPSKFTWFVLNTSISKQKLQSGPISPKSKTQRTKKDPKDFCPVQLLPEMLNSSGNSSFPPLVNFGDKLCYIFTSGTTGLPKAAVLTHSRAISMAYGPHYMTDLNNSDILYTPLPLYHIQGGICGVGQAIFFGITQVIVPKFSASRFWQDCTKHSVTVAQYLGEICRYLLKHSSPLERAHSVKKLYGNGMKMDIWKTFLDRFNYPQVMELYGATEGNCQLANFEGVVGVCGSAFYGFLGKMFPSPLALFKVDEEAGELLRDPETGFAIPCRPTERGELLGIISDSPLRQFHGYTDLDSTKEKIVCDVARQDDQYYRTGDIFYLDNLNYFHFVDRLGSAFRWKGENISSEEVTSSISRIVGLEKDIVTFGVSIPNTDGKGGMTVISVPNSDKDVLRTLVNRLNSCVADVLPSYARPVFIRFVPAIDSTGTFKLQKNSLQIDGFDISKSSDPIYFYVKGKYSLLSKDLYGQILEGNLRI